MSARGIKEGVWIGIMALCCLAIPILLLGGAGVVWGFLQNNSIIIAAGLPLIVLAIYLYSKKKR